MNSELDNKTKIISFIGITTVLVLLAILIYYIQGSSLDISADNMISQQSDWTSEKVGDCNQLSTRLFQVDNNNLLHSPCTISSNNLSIYTRTDSGWKANTNPYTMNVDKAYSIAIGIDNFGNETIASQPSYNDDADYYVYNQNEWQKKSTIPNSKSLFIAGIKYDSKNIPYILFRDIKIASGKISLKKSIDNRWENVNIPENITNTIQSLYIDNNDNIYLYGTVDNSSSIAIYSSVDNYQEHKFKYEDFLPEDGFESVSNATYMVFQHFEVDSNDKIHILTSKFGRKNNDYTRDYYYLTNKNGSWENKLIINDTVYDTHTGVSMILDMSGYPHIAYVQNSGFKYKYFNGSSWQNANYNNDVIDKMSSIKLIIDKNNISHILSRRLYYDTQTYHLAKQIAPYKEFNSTYPVTPIPSYIPTSTSTPTYTATIIENTDDADNDDILYESDTTSDSIPNTLIGSPSTNMPSDSSSSSSSPKITKLVSTGASLWFNILIAFLLAIGIGYLMFRDKIH